MALPLPYCVGDKREKAQEKGNREQGTGVAAAAHSVGMMGNDLSLRLMPNP